jgi:glycosyltransferase involved in cell wall biosynthesis
LEYTIKSVLEQKFKNYEYIIIDGGSTDGSIDLIKNYENDIHLWISEPDTGIYNAMNKGIDLAKGKWINFMNAGDRFSSPDILSNLFSSTIPENKAFIYGNWFLCDLKNKPNELIKGFANYKEGSILHQSVIYKKNLHDIYGKYLVTPKLIISDYLFFYILPEEIFYFYFDFISINDCTGISSNIWSYKQKILVDYILGRSSFKELIKKIIDYYIPKLEKYYEKKIFRYLFNYLFKKTKFGDDI